MKKLSDNTKALLFLWMITLFSCLIIFRRFLIGGELAVFRDVGSDTIQQYLMQYNSIINAMKEGNLSLWDFTNGFGTSVYALNLFHPLLFFLYLAGTVLGTSRVAGLMVYFEIGQILLAGTVAFFYLRSFRISHRSSVTCAYLYGLNGYLLVWGQHYQFGLFVILMPLLFLLAERAMKKRRFSFLLALGVCAAVLSSVYMAYMVLLTLGLYLLFRIFTLDETFRFRCILFLKSCCSILLGLLMMMVVFFPSALYILNTSTRLDSNVSVLTRFFGNMKPFWDGFYEIAFYRLFSSSLCSVSDTYSAGVNYYEIPSLFIGLLFIPLFFQYLFTIHRQNRSKKQKAAQYLAIALIAFFVLVQSGSMVYNAFVIAFSRHTFVFLPLAALVMGYTLDNLFLGKQKLQLPALVISLGLFCLLAWLHPDSGMASVWVICALGLLMMAVLCLVSQKKLSISPTLLAGMLLFLVMVNMCYDGFFTYNNRFTLKKSDGTYFEELYGEDVTTALNYLKETDTSFYRVEKDYDAGSYCMDGTGQNYFSVSNYNSSMNSHVKDFINNLWPNLERMSSAMFSYRQTVYDSEMASLCNVKYLLSHNPSLDVDGFTLLKQFGQIYLYKNENTSSIGKFFTQAITQDTVTYGLSSEVFDKDRFLTETLIIENEDVSFDEDEEGSEKEAAFQVASENLLSNYTLEKLTYKVKNQTFEGQDTVTIPIDSHALADSGYDRIYVDFTLILDDPSVSYITLNDSYQYYVSTSTDDPKVHVRLRLPASCQEITITNSDQSPLSGSVKKIRFYGSKGTLSENDQAVVSFDTPVRDTLVTGTVENKADGILMVSIPYEDGWTAYVDGEETTIHCVDYGFCGLELTAGSHEITLRYRAPGLMAGFFLSLMGWCIFIAGLLLRRRTRKKYAEISD